MLLTGGKDNSKKSFFVLLNQTGLFEQRVEQYLEELPDTEQSGVNKFLKGLGGYSSM